MTRVYLKEDYYFTLHLLKDSVSVQSESPILNIMRNSDNKFLNTDDSTWDDAPFDIALTESTAGIYQTKIDISAYNSLPDAYTALYKCTINDKELSNSEQLMYIRKNQARLA